MSRIALNRQAGASTNRPNTVLLYISIEEALTSHTTAVTSTSAGGMHRAESTPSRPSTLIHPNSKLAPIAPMYATTVLQTRMLTMRHCQRVPTNPFVCDWPTVDGDNRRRKHLTKPS